jgi:hypothetical protein
MRKQPFIRGNVLLIMLLFSISALHAQDEKFKAIFIYNFTKYVNWPQKPGNFVITVVGNDPITAEIQNIASKKTVGTTKIEVKNAKTPADITNCHILYVPEGKTETLAPFVAKAKEMNILMVTDNKDACHHGSCINFIDNGGKITFEISRSNIENNGLKVSGDLMQLGVSVN